MSRRYGLVAGSALAYGRRNGAHRRRTVSGPVRRRRGPATVQVSRPERSTRAGQVAGDRAVARRSPGRSTKTPVDAAASRRRAGRCRRAGRATSVTSSMSTVSGSKQHEVGVRALGDDAAVAQPEELGRRLGHAAAPRARASTSWRPRRQSARNRVVYGAPHMRSRCAPASEPPISTSSRAHASARSCPRRVVAVGRERPQDGAQVVVDHDVEQRVERRPARARSRGRRSCRPFEPLVRRRVRVAEHVATPVGEAREHAGLGRRGTLAQVRVAPRGRAASPCARGPGGSSPSDQSGQHEQRAVVAGSSCSSRRAPAS